jgi:hypothetical protein
VLAAPRLRAAHPSQIARSARSGRGAKQQLAGVLGKLDRMTVFDAWLVGHALWGRACQASGDQACAESEYETVRSAWTGLASDGSGMKHEALRKLFLGTLDKASEPAKERARLAFTVCKAAAEQYRWESPSAKQCSDWLEKNPAPAPP